MLKKFLFIVLPFTVFSQTQLPKEEVIELLTADTWNIAYNITPQGERVEHEDESKIRDSWVIFNKDGSYEMPGSMGSITKGKWTYNEENSFIYFSESRAKYRARVDEISELGLELNYVDDGGFKIGLIHYIFIPTEKSSEALTEIITSGTWQIISQKFDTIEDKTLAENLENTWFKFNNDFTYQRSEVIEGNPVIKSGTWFFDDEFRLNLDNDEMTIYSVVGDKSRMILTSTTDGINTIECRKLAE